MPYSGLSLAYNVFYQRASDTITVEDNTDYTSFARANSDIVMFAFFKPSVSNTELTDVVGNSIPLTVTEWTKETTNGDGVYEFNAVYAFDDTQLTNGGIDNYKLGDVARTVSGVYYIYVGSTQTMDTPGTTSNWETLSTTNYEKANFIGKQCVLITKDGEKCVFDLKKKYILSLGSSCSCRTACGCSAKESAKSKLMKADCYLELARAAAAIKDYDTAQSYLTCLENICEICL